MQSTEVDSLYSWIVAGSSFFLYMMMYGVFRLSGIMFVASIPRFGVGREAASFPYTFAGFTKNVAGPLVGILLHKFRIRTLILFGCVLAAVGIGTCFFAENIYIVTVLWGVVYGFGFALSSSLLPVLINQHFLKHRATAAGIAFSGMCVGSMIFPPIVEICIDFYGISGTFLILSGLVLNCVPFGIFLRERTLKSKDGEKGSAKKADRKRKSVSFNTFNTERTALLASNGHLQKNVLFYSSITERKPRTLSENRWVEESDLKLKNSESKVDISNVCSKNKHQKSISMCNDFDEKKERNEYKGLVASIRPPVVHTTNNLNIKEELKNQQLSKVPNLSVEKSLDKDDNRYENSNIYSSNIFEDKSSYYGTNKDGTHQNTDNDIKSNDQITSERITVTSTFPPHSEHKEEFNKSDTHQKTFKDKETQIVDLVEDSETENLPNHSEDKAKVYDDLAKESQDTACVAVPEHSKQDNTPKQKVVNSTEDGNGICSGNCSLILSFTYIVILLTKTLSNSISLCVNTVIFDYSRDIGIGIENEKYILIFSSMGELLGRLCLGRITDSHCLSKTMFIVVCSLGQGLGALCIAWATGFYVLGTGLFFYSFMGSVVQFMCPLIIADGIEEDKQAFAITSSSFLAGPASLAISPLIGYLRDEIGSYAYLFCGISILCVLTGIMWLFGYFLMTPKHSHV